MSENESFYNKQRRIYDVEKAENSSVYLLKSDGSKIYAINLALSNELLLEVLNYNTEKVLEHSQLLQVNQNDIESVNLGTAIPVIDLQNTTIGDISMTNTLIVLGDELITLA